MVRLGDVCEISSSKANLTDDKIWLLNLDMVEQQTGKIISYYYVNKNELNGSITQFDTENILYSKLRPNLNKVVVPDRNGFSTSELLPLKPNSKILYREYLALYLRSDSFVSWAISKTAGAKMPRLGTKALLDKEIPLPPLDEQRRIAATLDKVTDLISKRRQQLDKLDELVKARFVEMFGDPVSNPYDWNLRGLLQLGDCKNGMNFHSTDIGVNVHCLGVGDFKNLSCISDTSKLPTVSLTGMPSDEYMLKDGDIVFVRSNGNKALVGRSLVVYPATTPTTFSGFCIRFRLHCDEVKADYLLRVLKTDSIRKKMAGRGANIQNLNQKILGELQIPVPPLDLQNQFTGFVEQIEKTKVTISHSLEKLETLKKALMQEYFG